jgi:protein TonB
MYADRYAGPGRFSPAGLVAAVGINAGVVAALRLAAPYAPSTTEEPPLTVVNVPIVPPDAPPPEPQPREAVKPTPLPYLPKPIIAIPQPLDPGPTTTDVVPLTPPGPAVGVPSGTGNGEGVVIDPPSPPPPLLVGPALDPRYADALQPPYPSAEQRLGNDGRVTVRVRIGADGRVKEVRRVSATSDAFFRATEQQALRRWRFQAATRNGVAEEGWKTMAVTFVLAD